MSAFRILLLAVVLSASVALALASLVPDAVARQQREVLVERARVESLLVAEAEAAASLRRRALAVAVATDAPLRLSLVPVGEDGEAGPSPRAMLRQAANTVRSRNIGAFDRIILLNPEGAVADAVGDDLAVDDAALVERASLGTSISDQNGDDRFVEAGGRLYGVAFEPIIDDSGQPLGGITLVEEYDAATIVTRRSGTDTGTTYFVGRVVTVTNVTDPDTADAVSGVVRVTTTSSIGVPGRPLLQDMQTLDDRVVMFAPIRLASRAAGDASSPEIGFVVSVESAPMATRLVPMLAQLRAFDDGTKTIAVAVALGLFVFFALILLHDSLLARATRDLARRVRENATENDPLPLPVAAYGSWLRPVAEAFNTFLDAYRSQTPMARRTRQESTSSAHLFMHTDGAPPRPAIATRARTRSTSVSQSASESGAVMRTGTSLAASSASFAHVPDPDPTIGNDDEEAHGLLRLDSSQYGETQFGMGGTSYSVGEGHSPDADDNDSSFDDFGEAPSLDLATPPPLGRDDSRPGVEPGGLAAGPADLHSALDMAAEWIQSGSHAAVADEPALLPDDSVNQTLQTWFDDADEARSRTLDAAHADAAQLGQPATESQSEPDDGASDSAVEDGVVPAREDALDSTDTVDEVRDEDATEILREDATEVGDEDATEVGDEDATEVGDEDATEVGDEASAHVAPNADARRGDESAATDEPAHGTIDAPSDEPEREGSDEDAPAEEDAPADEDTPDSVGAPTEQSEPSRHTMLGVNFNLDDLEAARSSTAAVDADEPATASEPEAPKSPDLKPDKLDALLNALTTKPRAQQTPVSSVASVLEESDARDDADPIDPQKSQTVPRVSLDQISGSAAHERVRSSPVQDSLIAAAQERLRRLRPDVSSTSSADALTLPPSTTPTADAAQATLYQEFVEAKERCGEDTSRLSYERFIAKLDRNRDALRARYQCSDVRFEVSVRDGRVTLKATPLR